MTLSIEYIGTNYYKLPSIIVLLDYYIPYVSVIGPDSYIPDIA